MPALPELHDGGGTVQIRDLEEEAYRDLLSDDEVCPSTRSSTAIAYVLLVMLRGKSQDRWFMT
jgi:hypothetical protein